MLTELPLVLHDGGLIILTAIEYSDYCYGIVLDRKGNGDATTESDHSNSRLARG
jgi:hypothetical protein